MSESKNVSFLFIGLIYIFKQKVFYEPSSFRVIFIFSLTQSKVSFDKLFLRNINIFKSTSYYTIIILRQVYFGRDFSLRSEGVMKCPGG